LFAVRDVFVVDAIILALFLVGGFISRRTLLRNEFQRRVYSICTIYILQKLILTGAALHQQTPLMAFLVLDLINLAGFTAMLAAVRLRALAAVRVGVLALAGLLARYGASVQWLTMEAYPIVGAFIFLAWNAAAARAHRALLVPR